MTAPEFYVVQGTRTQVTVLVLQALFPLSCHHSAAQHPQLKSY